MVRLDRHQDLDWLEELYSRLADGGPPATEAEQLRCLGIEAMALSRMATGGAAGVTPLSRRFAAIEARLAPLIGRDRLAWLHWGERTDLHALAEDGDATDAARLEALEIELRSARRMLAGDRPP